MYLLHRIEPIKINANFNTPEEVEKSEGQLSFDGVYKSVYSYADLLKGRDITLFIMGAHVGGWNKFDVGQPLAQFCDWNEIMDLKHHFGIKFGWHTWDHFDLTTVGDAALTSQIKPPFPMDYFAYPYGKFDDRVIEAVKKAGFKEAFAAGHLGDGTQWQRKRQYL